MTPSYPHSFQMGVFSESGMAFNQVFKVGTGSRKLLEKACLGIGSMHYSLTTDAPPYPIHICASVPGKPDALPKRDKCYHLDLEPMQGAPYHLS
jgi:hypothetical protein